MQEAEHNYPGPTGKRITSQVPKSRSTWVTTLVSPVSLDLSTTLISKTLSRLRIGTALRTIVTSYIRSTKADAGKLRALPVITPVCVSSQLNTVRAARSSRAQSCQRSSNFLHHRSSIGSPLARLDVVGLRAELPYNMCRIRTSQGTYIRIPTTFGMANRTLCRDTYPRDTCRQVSHATTKSRLWWLSLVREDVSFSASTNWKYLSSCVTLSTAYGR